MDRLPDPNTGVMDWDKLRILRAVAEAGSFTHAGDTLQEQIDSITTRTMADGSYYTDDVQQTLRPLYDQLHGTEPADGRAAQ